MEEDKNERKKKKVPLKPGGNPVPAECCIAVPYTRVEKQRGRGFGSVVLLRQTKAIHSFGLSLPPSPRVQSRKKKRQIANIKLNKTNGTDVAGY